MIEAADYDLIKNAFNFSERIAKEVMIPRQQVSGIDINDCNEATLEKLLRRGIQEFLFLKTPWIKS